MLSIKSINVTDQILSVISTIYLIQLEFWPQEQVKQI